MITDDPRRRTRRAPRPVLLAGAFCALALCGCTLGGTVASDAVSEASAGDRTSATSGALLPAQALPAGVPFVAGVTTVEQAEIVGEFSAHPVGRWQVAVLVSPNAEPAAPIVRADRELRRAGFVSSRRWRGSGAGSALLWMTKDTTSVRVRQSATNPWLLSYTVTEALGSRPERRAECTTSYCER